MTATIRRRPVRRLVDAYVEMWGTRDWKRRAVLVEQVFTVDAHYVDPLSCATGDAEIAAMVGARQSVHPGSRLVRTSGIDQVDDWLRFSWQHHAIDGTPLVNGTDTCLVGLDGRFASVVSFWGALPETD